MSEDTLIKKLEEINSLFKALGQIYNLAPTLRIPAPSIPKPKMVSAAAKNIKNPIKQAQQVKDPNVKAYAMQQATLQNKAQHNQLAFKSEDSALFYAFKDGKRLNSDPMTKENIHTHFGKDVELKPIVIEKLILAPNGQWKLEDK